MACWTCPTCRCWIDSSDSDSDSSGSDGEGGLTSSKKRAKLDKGGGGKGGKKHALPSSSALFNDASAGGAAFLDAGAGIYATDEVDAFDNRKAAVERKPWLSKKQTVAVTIEGTRSGDGEVANPDAVRMRPLPPFPSRHVQRMVHPGSAPPTLCSPIRCILTCPIPTTLCIAGLLCKPVA